jgi:hypothetical protein
MITLILLLAASVGQVGFFVAESYSDIALTAIGIHAVDKRCNGSRHMRLLKLA